MEPEGTDSMSLSAMLMFAPRMHPVLRAAATGLLLGLASTPCAAGVIAVPPANAQASERDLMLTILARRTLLLDAELGPLNVGVRVRYRVATLWGPVPSAELGFKAEQRLRALVELLEVRSELIVAPDSITAPGSAAPLPAGFLPPAPPPALPGLPREMPAPPPLPMAPAIGAPSPVIDETELPPRRLPQAKQ